MQVTQHLKALVSAFCLWGGAISIFNSAALANEDFEAQISELRSICDGGSSQICSKAIYLFLDSNRDSRVTLNEVETAQTRATAAVQDRGNSLTADERVLFGLALIGMKSAGAAKVFANFDSDGDDGLSHRELFADVKLDNRPFAVLANNPEAVNWHTLAGRFGKFGRSLVGMLPANSGK